MNVSHIISELSPINSKEKVDALIQKMNENHLIMNVYTKMAIRTAIQKVDVQEYFIERYDGGISEKEFEEEQKRERQAQNQLNKIKADRIKSLESHEEHPKKIVKRRKPKQKPKTKYKGSVLRTMKIFGPDYLKVNKKRKTGNKKAQTGQSKKRRPISTTRSVHAILIASGGMNKRY